MTPEISIVTPVFNERGSVEALSREIAAAFDGAAHEIVFVDDCSDDGTGALLAELKARYPQMRVMRHRRRSGQSRAIRSGVMAARGDIVVMLDGDGQYDPADAVRMVARLRAAGPELALIGGERVDRQDLGHRRFASKLGNFATRTLLDSPTRDSGCGLKVFRRQAFLELPYFDHMHRYYPVLMVREGYAVAFEPIVHRPRPAGVSKYTNWQRALVSIFDMLGVWWLRRRMSLPGAVDEV
jgi:glycosyltransferase involved in cell wall biosynthesis